MQRFRPGTALILVFILVLGYFLAIGQRREARLRAALAAYKNRAEVDLRSWMGWPVHLDWPDQTTLAGAIDRIKIQTNALPPFPKGVPIFVDVDGLRAAGQSQSSPVQAPPPDLPDGNKPSLRQKLRAVLEPLGLACEVKDGAIVITSRDRVDEAPVAADGEE